MYVKKLLVVGLLVVSVFAIAGCESEADKKTKIQAEHEKIAAQYVENEKEGQQC